MAFINWLITLLISPLAHAAYIVSTSSVVDLGYTRYQGASVSNGVTQYLGMRYAAPPLHELRFRAPQDPLPTTDIQGAHTYGPVCIGAGQNVTDHVDEDCLFINVFTPSNATQQSNLPVWVYIQGGAYSANANANYNGTQVVQVSGSRVVLVNFNYRVGALGFLASEEIRQDGDLNVGLLDQRKALEWVKEHISKFGGNPDHVVIHGASAGAGSVAHHLAAYGGRDDGLFVGAIPESPWWPAQRTVAESQPLYDNLKAGTCCSDLPCLRAADVNAIQSAVSNPEVPSGASNSLSLAAFLPVIDGTLIQDRLYRLYEQGLFVRVPLMVGSDTNEGSLFAPNATSPAEVSQFLKGLYPTLNPGQLDLINQFYPEMPAVPLHAPYFPSASAVFGDASLTCPGLQMTRDMAKCDSSGGHKVWNYRYNVQDPAILAFGYGVPHTIETEAIFGPDYGGITSPSIWTINSGIVPIVMNYYISFVRALDPNTFRDPDAPIWQPWAFRERLKIQTNMTEMESVPDDERRRCVMWRGLARDMRV